MNITRNCHRQVIAKAPQFFVTATRDIQTSDGYTIRPGDFLLIDPEDKGEEDCMVMVGETIEPWHNQANILGTLIESHRRFK